MKPCPLHKFQRRLAKLPERRIRNTPWSPSSDDIDCPILCRWFPAPPRHGECPTSVRDRLRARCDRNTEFVCTPGSYRVLPIPWLNLRLVREPPRSIPFPCLLRS